MENLKNERPLYDPYLADSKVLSGMFSDRESTDRAYNKLIAKGYSLDEISLFMSQTTRQNHFNYLKVESEFEINITEVGGEGYDLNGTIGALISLGIPESRVNLYYSGIMDGYVIIIVTPKDEADAIYFLTNWKSNRGEEVYY